jgi:hypothetical protein
MSKTCFTISKDKIKITLNKSDTLLYFFTKSTLLWEIKFVGGAVNEFENHVEVEFFPTFAKKRLNQKIDISDTFS